MSEPSLKNIKKHIIDNVLMKNIGLRAVMIIRRRTADGKFLSGSESYSEKPFVMPLGAASKMLGAKLMKNEDDAQIFTASSGAKWVLIKGGYKRYRDLAGRQTAKVDLNWSGRMMRNLGIIPGTTTPRETQVGFTSAEEKQKALWHNTLGAGKGKTKREFMGFTTDEYNSLVQFAGEEIAKKLKTALNILSAA